MGCGALILWDPEAAAVVLAGTMLASLLGQGWSALRLALRQTAALLLPGLDEAANRSALARVLYAIKRDGRHRTETALPPDPALAEIVAAYLRLGETAHLHAALFARRGAARAARRQAVTVWRSAGELAPVAGLAGTLYAIIGLVPDHGAGLAQSTAEAIATAAVSTLYGLVLGHLVCLPLAGAIMRRGTAQEAKRERLARWFEDQLPLVRGPGPVQPKTPVLVEAA